MKINWLKVLTVVALIGSSLADAVSEYAKEKKLEETVDRKVNEAMAELKKGES